MVLLKLEPERLLAEYKRRFDAQDIDGLRELRAESCVVVDHRSTVASTEHPAWPGSFDVRIELDELLDCDEQAIAILAAVRGAAPGSGAFEIAFGAVDVVELGRFVRIELFDRDAEAALLGRFHELSRQRSIAHQDDMR